MTELRFWKPRVSKQEQAASRELQRDDAAMSDFAVVQPSEQEGIEEPAVPSPEQLAESLVPEDVTNIQTGKTRRLLTMPKTVLLSILGHIGTGAVVESQWQVRVTDEHQLFEFAKGDTWEHAQVVAEQRAQKKSREARDRAISEKEIEQHAEAYIETVVEQYFPKDDFPVSADLIIPEDVLFRIDAYTRLQHIVEHNGATPTGDKIEAAVERTAQELQVIYDQNLQILLNVTNGQWTGDPITDFPLLQQNLFVGENRFFYNSHFPDTQYQKDAATPYVQMTTGVVNCTVAQFIPTILRDIYQDQKLDTRALDGIGFVTWQGHVETGHWDEYSEGVAYTTLNSGNIEEPVTPGLGSVESGAPGVFLPPNEALRYLIATQTTAPEALQRANAWTEDWLTINQAGFDATTAATTTTGSDQATLLQPYTEFAQYPHTTEPLPSMVQSFTHDQDAVPNAEAKSITEKKDRLGVPELSDMFKKPSVSESAVWLPDWTAMPESYEIIDRMFEYIKPGGGHMTTMYIEQHISMEAILMTRHFLLPHNRIEACVDQWRAAFDELDPKDQTDFALGLYQSRPEMFRSLFSIADFQRLFSKEQQKELVHNALTSMYTTDSYPDLSAEKELEQRLQRVPEVQLFPEMVTTLKDELQQDLDEYRQLYAEGADMVIAAPQLLLTFSGGTPHSIRADYVKHLTPDIVDRILVEYFPISASPDQNIDQQFVHLINDSDAAQLFFSVLNAKQWLYYFSVQEKFAPLATSFYALPYLDAFIAQLPPGEAAEFVPEIIELLSNPDGLAEIRFFNERLPLRESLSMQSNYAAGILPQLLRRIIEREPQISDVTSVDDAIDINKVHAGRVLIGVMFNLFDQSFSLDAFTTDVMLIIDPFMDYSDRGLEYPHKMDLQEHLHKLYLNEPNQDKRMRLLEKIQEWKLDFPDASVVLPEDLFVAPTRISTIFRAVYLPNSLSVDELSHPVHIRLLAQYHPDFFAQLAIDSL